MYAVVRTGSKQYRVEEGQEFLVEKLETLEPGQVTELNEVLLASDGTDLKVGMPILPLKVECVVVGHELGPKVRGVKYRRRKNYRRTFGHRQQYTRLRVQKLGLN